MNDQEKMLGKINQGKVSNIVIQNIAPILKKKSDVIIAQMKNNFRTGNLDHLATQCLIAQLCSYDDLMSELNGHVNSGETAAKRLTGGK